MIRRWLDRHLLYPHRPCCAHHDALAAGRRIGAGAW